MKALLMATRGISEPEAEPVRIETDEDSPMVVFTLDDGERLELDAGELRIALEEAA